MCISALPDPVYPCKQMKLICVCATWTHLLPRESVIGRKRDCDSRVEVSAGDVTRAGDESHDQSSPGDAHARESDLAVAGLVHYDHAAADEDEEEGCDELCCHLQETRWAAGQLRYTGT